MIINELKSGVVSSTLNEKLIFMQVEKICKCEQMKTKKLLCKFLSYIVSESLAGRTNKIKGYSIALDVLGKDKDFDSDQNALVRIHAGRLRHILKEYYSNEGKYDEVIIEIPLGQYVPEFKNNPISKNSELLEEAADEKGPGHLQPTIAILPFRNLSGNDNMDYFVRGFAEELSVELTKFEDLIIFDCRYEPSNVITHSDTREFIKKNRVRFALEGSLSFDNKSVKVLVKLTDISSGTQIWAQNYTRELTSQNLFHLQESISQDVSETIGNEFGIIYQKLSRDKEQYPPKRMETYHAILRYYQYELEVSEESAIQAFTALTQALEIEPDPGILTAYLAAMHAGSYLLDSPIVENSYQLCGELAEKALKLDPNSMAVQSVMVLKHFTFEEKELMEQLFHKCIKKSPKGALRVGNFAFHYALYGGWDQGRAIIDGIMERNSSFPVYLYAIPMLDHYRKKEFKEALIEANKYVLPGLFWPHLQRIATLGQLGKKGAATPEIADLLQLKPDFEEKHVYLISRYIKEDELVDQVIDGLRKAGMNL